jgi:glucosamine kinase
MTDNLFLGIDGGGTHCRARLAAADGKPLGEGVGGPANARLDPKLVMQSILTASRGAATSAGLAEAELARAHAGFGLAGGAQKSDCARLLIEPHPFASVVVETDAYASWLGAFGGEDGAILIMGTGSNGVAIVGGEQFQVSGWGGEISDEASGNWIGREAIRRSIWAQDGRAQMTKLAAAILARFGNSGAAIADFAKSARPTDYASLFPLVLQHAEQRDPLGLELIQEAAGDASRMILRLLDHGAPTVGLIGSVAEKLESWLPPPVRAWLSVPRGDALDGAILMARRAQGLAAT